MLPSKNLPINIPGFIIIDISDLDNEMLRETHVCHLSNQVIISLDTRLSNRKIFAPSLIILSPF